VHNNPLNVVDLAGHDPMTCQNTPGLCSAIRDAVSGGGSIEDGYAAYNAQQNSTTPQDQQGNAPRVTAVPKANTVTYTYADGTTVILKGTHPWRDSNPGDLIGGYGSIGRDAGGGNVMAIYPGQSAGWSAAEQLLTTKYANSSILDTMMSWAPPGNGNDPVKYAAALAKAVGVPVSTKVSALTRAQTATVLTTIASREGFYAAGNTATINLPATIKMP